MKMWWIIPAGVLGLLGLLTGRKGGGSGSAVAGYTVKDWVALITSMANEANISPIFCLAWLKIESGGNPCAWGSAKAKGPDGHPREQGIAQLYNPDDMERYGVPSGAFRVYCIPGTQECSRRLTANEMVAQAKAAMKLILHSREVAKESAAKNGLRWSGKDMYKLIKLVHGLPGLVKTGMALATKHLNRAPRDWNEYKVAINQTKMDAGTEAYRKEFPRLFANAETAAADLPDNIKVVS